MDGKSASIGRCRGELEKADGTIHWCIFFAMEVVVARLGDAVRRLVVVFQKVVYLFQNHDLKDEGRQKKGGNAAIYVRVFQQKLMPV